MMGIPASDCGTEMEKMCRPPMTDSLIENGICDKRNKSRSSIRIIGRKYSPKWGNVIYSKHVDEKERYPNAIPGDHYG